MDYLKTIDKNKLDYFNILEPNFPNWLNDYINTKELLHQQYVSVSCGMIYSDLSKNKYFYSSLDHSIAVALIIWHFTHSKEQTLSGLFHDISTPVFKHCVDFLNGDYIKQESTEDKTLQILINSKDIMSLLKKDNIDIKKVYDYHIYPIADNDTPKLSSDRLEYSLSNALFIHNILTLDEVKKIYNDIEIQYDNDIELGFKNLVYADKFVYITSKMSVLYRDDKTRYSMQLLADILKRLCQENIITKDDLYILKEKEIIDIILNSKYSDIFNIWRNSKNVKISSLEPSDVYNVNIKSKVRYINPLVNGIRITKLSLKANELINNNLNYDMSNYIYLDNINFKNKVKELK